VHGLALLKMAVFCNPCMVGPEVHGFFKNALYILGIY